jgi:hypothetical protein
MSQNTRSSPLAVSGQPMTTSPPTAWPRHSVWRYGPNTNVVLRARDAHKLARAKRAVEDMLERVRGAQSSSA